MSCTTAAAPRFRKLSAVDMMAANSPREDDAREHGAGVELEELRRRLVGAGQLGMAALDDEGPHRQSDAEPQQRADRVARRAHGQAAARVLDAPVHHQLGDHVGLAGPAEGEHHQPRKRPHHAQRAPGADRLGVVGDEGGHETGRPAVHGREGRGEHEDGGDDHDRALHEVGVDRREDAPGDAVEHQHRAGDGHAGGEGHLGDERHVVQEVAQHRGHREDLRPQIADHAEEDGDRRQQPGEFAAVARGHRVGQRDGVAQLRHHAQPLGQQEVHAAERQRADHRHPRRAQSHAVDEPPGRPRSRTRSSRSRTLRGR